MRLVAALLVIASAILIASVSADNSPVRVHREFSAWRETYGKTYTTPQEQAHRFAVYNTNRAIVAKHNAEADAGKHSFRLGLTRFADLTNEEYKAQVLSWGRKDSSHAAKVFSGDAKADVPASVDWRTKGVVTPVKDQGQCGSCWSFSATGSMEGAHALATGNLISLSEQELVDCANNGLNNCTAGGEMSDGFTWAIKKGMETESDYPYQGTDGHSCAFDPSKVVVRMSSYVNVTSGSESALQQAIVNQPTVSVAIDASSMWFQLYSSGVYDDSSCKNGIDDLDHGVLVVGYGTDSASGKDYWIVKNSWNASWGNQGYIWMVRNKDNQCGIATDASYPLP